MKLIETSIEGAWLLEIEPIFDERGFFARSFCSDTLAAYGLHGQFVQQSVSFNLKRGTLRGMHYQSAPHEEIKLVRATQGCVFDVILDLRRESSSYLRWYAVELSATNRRSLYIPKGVAHGFQTLDDNSEMFYQMANAYEPGHSRGVRWNDPAFGIVWPLSDPILSERDANYLIYSGSSL